MKTLTLSLKKQWFDMIKSGEKKEEYREICDYWGVRFAGRDVWANEFCIKDVGEIELKRFDRLVFTLGYPKSTDKERRIEFKNPKIRIGTGRPEWGAEPGKNYFVITWEEKMETSIPALQKELNKKDCPKFIVLKEFMILNTNNMNSILFDIKKNCKKTKDDPFIEILFGEEREKIYGLRVSQILEAIKQGKEKTNDQAPV